LGNTRNSKMELKNTFGKILYGSLFVIVLPLLLILWARATENSINLPAISNPILGIVLSSMGLLFVIIGMLNLWAYGKGLPMNAFPPKKYVINGVYKLMPHPIYFGACILNIGISIITQSASGFWLISPVLIIACIALVMGYENEDIEKRFGKSNKHLFSLPENTNEKPGLWNRVSVFILVFIPWLVLYQLVIISYVPEDAISVYLKFENQIPVIEWTEAFYVSSYIFVLLAPILVRKKNQLRKFMGDFLLATGIGIFIQFFVPLIAVPRPFEASNMLGELLQFERAYDSPAAAFPSFHVALSFVAYAAYAKIFPKAKALFLLIPVLISISCITTGMHGIIDILGGLLLFYVAVKRVEIWRKVLDFCEKIANSWKAWQIGSVRIINHGIYAGAASFVGMLIVGNLLGPSYFVPLLLVALAAIFGAGLWAQIIEGSSGLSRPFGYYGGIIGGVIGCVLVSLFSEADSLLLIGAFAVCSPWVQGIGRFRCFVQGCCHGKNVSEENGIKHFHEKSRVCKLSKMEGESLHPTPLYSIISNIIIGIVLARLWFSGASLTLIAGLYLILVNLYRFVEEAYRGEPQTPIWNGLRLYQWTALIGLLLGGILTAIPSSAIIPKANINIETFILSVIVGLISFFAMGIDFPNSNKRFSRLAM